jgi:hypothetical protein
MLSLIHILGHQVGQSLETFPLARVHKVLEESKKYGMAAFSTYAFF